MTYRSAPDQGPSLWLARHHSLRRTEIAVVGGGLVGLSTAYWLARAGRRVTVVEASGLAGRASGRNAGFLLTGSAEPYSQLIAAVGRERARAFWERSRENRRLLRAELLDSGEVDAEVVREGSWVAAPDDAEKVAELRASAELLAEDGFRFRWVEGEELARASGSPRLGAAFQQPEDVGLDPVRLARGIAARVQALGEGDGSVEVLTGARVRALEAREGGGVRLATEAGEVQADAVVVAVNAYIPQLIPQLAAEVRPVRGQMLATGPGLRVLEGVWYIDEGFQYIRQLPDGTVVLGGCRQVAVEDEVGYREQPTHSVQSALERFLDEYFPALAGRAVARRWAGTMGFSSDGFPRVGTVPRLPDALYAAGLTGHGLSLSFALGKHLADRLAGKVDHPFLP
ncbi:MAG: FAD-binding oxidoreductase [Acidobacteriota bacterium]